MAITTINYRPHIYTPAYNPIIFSFTSDKISESNMSYVVDVYLDGAANYSYRIKQRPNPSGVCQVDVSKIVQGNLYLKDYLAEDYGNFLKDDTVPTLGSGTNRIVTSVYIKVGEEYLVNGVLTLFNGSDVEGDPAYAIYSEDYTSNPVIALPSALRNDRQIAHMESTTDSGYFNPYLMDGDGLFLSRQSGDRIVKPSDYHTLTFINWNYGASGSYGSPVQGLLFKYYNESGTLLSSAFLQNSVSSGYGGGPTTNPNYTTATEDLDFQLMAVNCGPGSLTYPSTTAYYTVQAYYKDTANPTTTEDEPASELVTFRLDTECNDLYPSIRLSWLNDLGGRDYYNFDMLYEKTTSSQEKIYYDHQIQWSGTTPIETSSNEYLNWLKGGDKVYNKTTTTTFRCESDWLTQDEVDFLGYLPTSSSVIAYLPDYDYPVTARVSNLNYSYQLVKQQKLIQAAFDLTFTKIDNSQSI